MTSINNKPWGEGKSDFQSCFKISTFQQLKIMDKSKKQEIMDHAQKKKKENRNSL
jgi:hypothetical protein